ncbi:MAG: hypothetical protein CR986_00945 [Ignavibacteriae bacterium]|nr:MAG: hypothetical protein CR986_00945 [Ignavibacteriota bacterium]
MKQKNKQNTNIYKEIGPYLGLGTQLAASIVVMLYIGYKLDNVFNLYPLLTIIFTLFGGAAGIFYVIKQTLLLNKKKKID